MRRREVRFGDLGHSDREAGAEGSVSPDRERLISQQGILGNLTFSVRPQRASSDLGSGKPGCRDKVPRGKSIDESAWRAWRGKVFLLRHLRGFPQELAVGMIVLPHASIRQLTLPLPCVVSTVHHDVRGPCRAVAIATRNCETAEISKRLLRNRYRRTVSAKQRMQKSQDDPARLSKQ